MKRVMEKTNRTNFEAVFLNDGEEGANADRRMRLWKYLDEVCPQPPFFEMCVSALKFVPRGVLSYHHIVV